MRKIIQIASYAFALVFASATINLYAEATAPAGGGNPLGGFIPLIVIFFIFYFLLIRPQQKKAKEHQKMLAAVKKDDRIITTGGIYGTVTAVKGDTLELKIAEGVKIQLAKSAVAAVLPSENQPVTPEVVK